MKYDTVPQDFKGAKVTELLVIIIEASHWQYFGAVCHKQDNEPSNKLHLLKSVSMDAGQVYVLLI